MEHERRSRGIRIETDTCFGWTHERCNVNLLDGKEFRNLRVHFDVDWAIHMLAQHRAGPSLSNLRLKHLMRVSRKGGGVAASLEYSSKRFRAASVDQQIDITHRTLAG